MRRRLLGVLRLTADHPFGHVGSHPFEQARKVAALGVGPIGHQLADQFLAHAVDGVGHLASRFRHLGFTHTLVAGAGTAHHQTQFVEACDLAADGGVVASHHIGQLHHADRTATIDAHQQREQRAFERHGHLGHQSDVGLGTAHEADDVEQRVMHFADIFIHMCIIHIVLDTIFRPE